jgi:ABC-type polysaccharide/polyol phosphate transport system ATPase subunit
MNDVVVLEHVNKQFKRFAISGGMTLKEALLKGKLFKRGSAGHIEALKDINLSVSESTVVGIIGPNGAGKSTLLRVLAGIYRPTSGQVKMKGRISALLSLGLGFHPDFSGRENILISGLALGLSRKQVNALSEEIIHFAELEQFIDAPMRTYSSGMYMRLAFSVAVNVDPDILLVDEVLAVGDAAFAQKSRARMEDFKKSGKTIVLATHDLTTAETWCQQVLFLHNGQIQSLGNPKEVVAKYREFTASITH